MTIEDLGQVHVASAQLAAQRETTRKKAITAIRALEARLVGALGGEPLRGLPEIAHKLYAAQVRRAFDVPLLRGRPALVLGVTGRLEIVHKRENGEVLGAPATDADLLIEDLEHVISLLWHLLPSHVAHARKKTVRYAEIEKLSEKLQTLIDT